MLYFVPWVCGGRHLPVLCSVSSPDYLSLLISLGSYSNRNLGIRNLGIPLSPFFGVNGLEFYLSWGREILPTLFTKYWNFGDFLSQKF